MFSTVAKAATAVPIPRSGGFRVSAQMSDFRSRAKVMVMLGKG